MNQLIILLAGIFVMAAGAVLGYFARQSIAKRKAGTIEAELQGKISKAREAAEKILQEAKEKGLQLLNKDQKEQEESRRELLQSERLLLKRENVLEEKAVLFEEEKNDFRQKAEKLRKIKEGLESLQKEALEKLEKVAKFSPQEAKKEIFALVEKEEQREILEKIRKLEQEGWQRFEQKAKELTALAIQKVAISQAQEVTTATITLPSEEIKGKIIGKEGRNIRTLERLTGCEFVIDETPETVVISAFDPVRRQIAKTALEKLIQDGRIQPARIEEMVEKARSEIEKQIKEAGEQAIYETGIIGLDPKIVQLLGRLRFRTSYGQNVLLHSLEVAFLAEALAQEIGANPRIAKKAGLLHDIGKSVDHQIEGSHVDIGIKILEKFGVEKEVIEAMKSHHEEYPYETLESILVQTADAISGARPGARKDTLENYLKRLADLEQIANNFPGVEKSWALQAGREIRVFVKPEEIDDLQARKLARDIADRIQEELRFPGEIKVNIIREMRVLEYAR